MPGTFTNGFDIVVELSEARIRQIIRDFFISESQNGFPIPASSLGLPADFPPLILSYQLAAQEGVRVNIHPGNQVMVDLLFDSVELNLMVAGTSLPIARFSSVLGTIGFMIRIQGENIQITLNQDPIIAFNNDEFAAFHRQVNVILKSASQPEITEEDLRNRIRDGVRAAIDLTLTTLPRIPLNTPVGSTACAVSARAMDLVTLENSALLCMALRGAGIPERPLNPEGFTSSHLNGKDSTVMFSNDALLSVGICYLTTQRESPFFGAKFTGTGDCRTLAGPFNNPPLGNFVYQTESLSICVEGNRLMVRGRMSSANELGTFGLDFEAPVSFIIDEANHMILPSFDPDQIVVTPFSNFDIGVYIVLILIIPVLSLINPFIGVIAVILVALIQPITALIIKSLIKSLLPTGIAALDKMVRDGYNSLPREVLSILGSLEIEKVELDDLEANGLFGKNFSPPRLYISDTIISQKKGAKLSSLSDKVIPTTVSREYEYTVTTFGFSQISSIQWFVNGIPVSGSGTVQDLHAQKAQYRISSDKLVITNPMGIECLFNIGVRVTAVNGLSMFFCDNFILDGTGVTVNKKALYYEMLDLSSIRVVRGPIICPGPGPGPFREKIHGASRVRPLTEVVAESLQIETQVVETSLQTIKTRRKLK